MVKYLLAFALLASPAFAAHWGHTNAEPGSERAREQLGQVTEPVKETGGSYTIHSTDPRQSCWELMTRGGPKGRHLMVCEDK